MSDNNNNVPYHFYPLVPKEQKKKKLYVLKVVCKYSEFDEIRKEIIDKDIGSLSNCQYLSLQGIAYFWLTRIDKLGDNLRRVIVHSE